MELVFTLSTIREAAAQFLQEMGEHRVIAVHGVMGAGKTTFIHAACDLLGVKDIVGSPTFSIINEYAGPKNERIYHIDLYRLKDEMEAMDAGIEECIYSGHLCFIEWPEKAVALLPEGTMHIQLLVINETKRKMITE